MCKRRRYVQRLVANARIIFCKKKEKPHALDSLFIFIGIAEIRREAERKRDGRDGVGKAYIKERGRGGQRMHAQFIKRDSGRTAAAPGSRSARERALRRGTA